MLGDDEFAVALIAEHRNDIGLLLDVDEQADRLAVAAPTRQFRRVYGVEPAVAGEDQNLRCGFGEKSELQTIVGLERQTRKIGDLTAQRTNPAFLGDHDGDRFALDQSLLDRGFVMRRRLGETGAALAERRFRPECLAHFADLFGDFFPLLLFRAQQFLDRFFFRA